MPRAEVGTPKYIANKMKSKGLQRLRWYCQGNYISGSLLLILYSLFCYILTSTNPCLFFIVCEKQCRDENGFRCHTQTESHVRQMLVIGENPQKKIAEYSAQFKQDFISLLRSSHGEKKINFNRFYQEYISDKNHIHMNATKWVTLSEFVKYLGNEGICKVETDPEKEGAFTIAWIDNSPEALLRRELASKRGRLEKEDLSRDQRLLQQQVKKALEDHKLLEKNKKKSEINEDGSEKENATVTKELQRDGSQEKIKLSMSFGRKPATKIVGRPNLKKLKM